MTASVYTIHAFSPFLETLGACLRDDRFGFGLPFGTGPETSDMTVLLPTRRACRAFREVLLAQSGGRATFLPRIRPIGDADEDELLMQGGAEGDPLLPEAPSGLTRDLHLMRLILRWRKTLAADGDAAIPQTAADALWLARQLGVLLDLIETEGGDLSRLSSLVPEDFAAHYGLTLSFLTIVSDWWPAWLEETGQIGSAERRNRLIAAECRRIEAGDTAGPIVAAGSTGSIPASARLLAAIARAPRGALVLPGFDTMLEGKESTQLTSDSTAASHPQTGMAGLVATIGLEPGEVVTLDPAPRDPARVRTEVLNAAMATVTETVHWPDLADRWGQGAVEAAFAPVTLIEADGEDEEALAIALSLRECAETPGKSAALVTPNRVLARRVIAHLNRWSIEIDDSAGTPLHQTRAGVLLQVLLEVQETQAAAVPLLACLKHPLVRLGLTPATCRARARVLERHVLRGRRPAPGFDGLVAAIDSIDLPDDLVCQCRDTVSRIADAFAPLDGVLRGENPSLAAVAAAIWDTLLMLARDETGARPGLSGEDGEALRLLLEALATDEGPPLLVAAHEAAGLFRTFAAAIPIRPAQSAHPRLHIFGLLEARLQPMDRVILAGLNEGDWPDIPTTDPWLSRPMRTEVGLSTPERRIGLMAHDFVQAASAPEVVMTRSRKSDGSPTIRSRFLQRLLAILDLLGCAGCLDPAPDQSLLAWAKSLDAAPFLPISEPYPAPPVALRPRTMSVTAIERWIRDPYSIYAERILKLKPLDPLNPAPGAADRGTIIHNALAAFMAGGLSTDFDADRDRLIAIGDEHFRPLLSEPDVRAIWWPRFLRIADWFVAQEHGAGVRADRVLTEIDGAIRFDAPAGPFTLTARADRLDLIANRVAIIDYKTGTVPTAPQVTSGLSPQLPLEAAIALGGGFSDLPASPTIERLTYLGLKGGSPAGEMKTVMADTDGTGDIDTHAQSARDALEALVAGFDHPTQAYRVMTHAKFRSRYNDYTHLSRLPEWSAGVDGEGGA